MKSFELKIKAKHLIGADFVSNTDCGIARALKDQLGPNFIIGAGLEYSYINWEKFCHEKYGIDDFDNDLLQAEFSTDPETIIRTLSLTNDRPAI